MAHILIPTDFSSNALNAALYAIHLHGAEGNTFTVLNSYMLPRGAASTMWSIDDMLAKESNEGTTAFVEKLREELGDLNVEINMLCEHGDLPNVINMLAAEPQAPQVVVMGTQGATGLKEVLMGSNTADVIKHSGLPVIAVPQDARYKAPKRILLADDGGPVQKETLSVLLDIARRSHAEIMIVRVMKEDDGTEESSSSALYDKLLGAIPHSHHYVSGENVNTALHDMADQSDADLVVVVHRQRGLFEQLFHRSTSTKLAMHTHIPMLVLQQSQG